MPRNIKYTKDLLLPIVDSSNSYSNVIRCLGLKPSGGNYRQIKKWIRFYNIDVSHFTGSAWSRGKTAKTCDIVNRISVANRLTNDQVFCENSRVNSGCKILKRLLNDYQWEYKCNICGINDWLGKKLTLHVDHINGINNDNRIENLRILCPNCHQQTITWGAGNSSKKKIEYNNKINAKIKDINKQIQKKEPKKCIHCGNNVSKKSKLGRCKKCSDKIRRDECYRKVKNRPSYDVLKIDIENLNYCGTGRKYGVSDNAIRKWMIGYEKILYKCNNVGPSGATVEFDPVNGHPGSNPGSGTINIVLS